MDPTLDPLEHNRRRLVALLESLNAPEGAHLSALDRVILLRTSRHTIPTPVLYEPCIVIVAQGTKRFHLPEGLVTYDAHHYLVLTVPVPADCETIVAPTGPFLGFALRIDLTLLSDLLHEVTQTSPLPPLDPAHLLSRTPWVSAPPMDLALSDTAVRLLQSLQSPRDTAVLGPQLVRELLYRVLCGPHGNALQELLLSSGPRASIHRILHHMHLHLANPLNVPALAHTAGMSVSALHLHFKAVTGTSPVQYLKAVRLGKARTLMIQNGLTAALAADQVGYESPSQFSREFRRHFGRPPAEETSRFRASIGLTA